MPYRPQRRELYLNLNVWKLIFGVALGLWLGLLAIVGTLWGVYKVVGADEWAQIGDTLSRVTFHIPSTGPVAPPAPQNLQAPQPSVPTQGVVTPGATATPATPSAGAGQAPTDPSMFDQYQKNLSETTQRQAQDEHNQRFNSPNCQYWLKQQQATPSASTQENVRRACD